MISSTRLLLLLLFYSSSSFVASFSVSIIMIIAIIHPRSSRGWADVIGMKRPKGCQMRSSFPRSVQCGSDILVKKTHLIPCISES
jgi:hypothetical protein